VYLTVDILITKTLAIAIAVLARARRPIIIMRGAISVLAPAIQLLDGAIDVIISWLFVIRF
jgi:hypothetical protein